MELFIRFLFENPSFYFSWVGSIIVSICLHEFSHAFMAHEFGDNTASSQGHLTLNPIKQMGLISLGCLLLFGICWGAVPVTQDKVSRPGAAVISAAGPLANLSLATLCAALLRFFPWAPLLIAMQANCLLFLFNILPVPELDGWGIIEPFVPVMRNLSEETRSKCFRWFIFLLWFTPASKLFLCLNNEMVQLLLPQFH